MKARRVVFLEEADADLMDAMRWHEERRQGLGDEFFSAVDAAISLIRTRPETFPRIYGEVRRALVRRFPYAVHFLVESDTIVVLSVYHAKRDPKGWQDRT